MRFPKLGSKVRIVLTSAVRPEGESSFASGTCTDVDIYEGPGGSDHLRALEISPTQGRHSPGDGRRGSRMSSKADGRAYALPPEAHPRDWKGHRCRTLEAR